MHIIGTYDLRRRKPDVIDTDKITPSLLHQGGGDEFGIKIEPVINTAHGSGLIILSVNLYWGHKSKRRECARVGLVVLVYLPPDGNQYLDVREKYPGQGDS